MQIAGKQLEAVDRIASCMDTPGDECRIGGLAGTGKTVAVREAVSRLEGKNIAVCALAGKAADVLRRKGVHQAQTIHSLIYKYEPMTRTFNLRPDLGDVAGIIVDEASMVSEDLYRDLKSFGLPVAFVGDHGQLQPVGRDMNLMDDLSVELTEIHRQAAGNPIIDFAHAVRGGAEFGHGEVEGAEVGRVTIAPARHFLAAETLLWADQVICAYNRTRHQVNDRIRRLMGRRDLVEPGDRLIVLQNNRELCVFNGQQVIVEAVEDVLEERLLLTIQTDDGQQRKSVPFWTNHFGVESPEETRWIRDRVVADYAYAVTAHKSQGSEWAKVLVLEQGAKWNMERWRYTAVTRAAEELIYCM